MAIPTHVYAGNFNDLKDKLFSRCFPIHVALGKAPILNIWIKGFDNRRITDFYRWLNLGFKLALSGSSDCYFSNRNATGVGPGKDRTYLMMDSLTPQNVVKAYRQGKTFMTNGPLVIFKVNGKNIGDTLLIDGKESEVLNCSVEAYSGNELENVEIIKNGEIVKSFSGDGKKKIVCEFPLEVRYTCWLAARCTGKKSEDRFNYIGPYAHTSPIYIQFGKNKMLPKEEDVKYFLKWLDDLKVFTQKWSVENPELCKKYKKDVDQLYSSIDKAKSIYSSLQNNPRDFNQE